LEHESGNDAMKVGVAVAEAVQVCAEGAEVLAGLGALAAEELDDDAAHVLLLDGDVEEDSRVVGPAGRGHWRGHVRGPFLNDAFYLVVSFFLVVGLFSVLVVRHFFLYKI